MNVRHSNLALGARYFGVVFGAGFALGTMRVLWLVPRLGERWAELLEMPVMGLVMFAAARGMVRISSQDLNCGIIWVWKKSRQVWRNKSCSG